MGDRADIREYSAIVFVVDGPHARRHCCGGNGGYRQVHVEAKAKGYGKLQVRTRSGYFPRIAHQENTNTSLADPSKHTQ